MINTIVNQALRTALHIRKDLSDLNKERPSAAVMAIVRRFGRKALVYPGMGMRNVKRYVKIQGFNFTNP